MAWITYGIRIPTQLLLARKTFWGGWSPLRASSGTYGTHWDLIAALALQSTRKNNYIKIPNPNTLKNCPLYNWFGTELLKSRRNEYMEQIISDFGWTSGKSMCVGD